MMSWRAFQALVDSYIAKKYPRKTAEVAPLANPHFLRAAEQSCEEL